MRHSKLFVVTFFISVFLVTFVLPYSACAKTISLTFAHSYPAEDMRGKIASYWANKVEEETDGQINVNVHPGGQLISGGDLFSSCARGGADVIFASGSYFTGELPEIGLFLLPFPPGNISSEDYPDIYLQNKDFFDSKFQDKGIQRLCVFPFGSFCHIISSKEVRTKSDLNGLKLRAAGGKALTESVSALGASPVKMSSSEMYTGIQRGTIDGGITLDSSYISHSLYEVAPYITNCRWYSGLFFILMNNDVWENLDDDLRDKIKDVSLETKEFGHQLIMDTSKEMKKKAENKAEKYYMLPDNERDKWVSEMEPIWNDWAEEKGKTGKKLLKMMTEN